MFTRYKTPRDGVWAVHRGGARDRPRVDHHHPSGRHGGPGIPLSRKHHDRMLAGAGMKSYTLALPFSEVLKRLRRDLSRRGFEIMRECDLRSRIKTAPRRTPAQCRVLYIAEPEVLATALSTHPSAALWLPVPVVLSEREDSVAAFHPAEAIVRDRAALLGLRTQIEQSYRTLAEVLESLSTR